MFKTFPLVSVFLAVFSLVCPSQAKNDELIKKHGITGIGQVIINVNVGQPAHHVSKQSPKLGTRQNPAQSCKAILENDRSAPSGPYYIKTNPTITKVYCYMKDIPGCGRGGWTTIMKTNGNKPTFRYYSALWSNKHSYHVTGGQSGVDEQETKLPTYWTLPFTRLCLGMKTKNHQQPKWILLNYKAKSLYSVIADGQYRSFSIGRSQWKSLIADSSLQINCNREGFNNFPPKTYRKLERVRLGVLSNNEKDCKTIDSRLGFGGSGKYCGAGKVSTGNCARGPTVDNGAKTIIAYGYILAQ